MAKNNSDFFKEKKIWSEIKDSLLGCYLKPYFQKIISTRRPVLYIDCFAGKGLFDDGKPGSPVIALDIINECLKSTSLGNAVVKSNFIELNHSNDLQKNLSNYKNITVIQGKFEDNIESLLERKNLHNVFLYIDPYGIKALQFSLFEKLAHMNLNSLELLINMNSFGFIREACHALNIKFDIDVSDDIIEYEPTILRHSKQAIEALNNIAGGNYWTKIINDYKLNKIDGYEAETRFSEEYCKRLMQVFKYILNMPIRLKKEQRPKYRMIYATNHEEGCILMNDNICKRWEALRDVQNSGQISMFSKDVDNKAFDENEIRKDLIKVLGTNSEFKNLNTFLAGFISLFGIRCCTSDIKEQLKILEKNKKIEVKRYPPKTATGKVSSFWDCKSEKKVSIRGTI
jgi:three-Cys-motif partner protein